MFQDNSEHSDRLMHACQFWFNQAHMHYACKKDSDKVSKLQSNLMPMAEHNVPQSTTKQVHHSA